MRNKPFVSIVVIGYNEARNLNKTFEAITNDIIYPKENIEIIYVDTGSKDKSITIAEKFTDKVFIETSDWPTPGLARNKGLMEAKYDIIHFLDGDIKLDPNYLQIAIPILQQKKAEAVFGRLLERKGGINNFLLAHWKTKKEGYVLTSGGGGTYLKEPLLRINGYDERIRKGQENEMGERFCNAGYRIWYSPIVMGIHDYGIENLKSYFKVAYIAGRSMFYNSILVGTTNFIKDQKKISRNNLLQNITFYTCLALLPISYMPLLCYIGLFLFLFIIKLSKRKFYRNKQLFFYHIISEVNRYIIFWGQISIIFQIYVTKSLSSPQEKQNLNKKSRSD